MTDDTESEQLVERMEGENDAEYLKRTGNYGHKQTPATKKKISNASKGAKNSQWAGGKHHTYQRRVMGLKDGDKKVVHHKDKNRSHNKKSNFKVMTMAKHNKLHHKK